MSRYRSPVERATRVAAISASTVWRWLNEDAIRPWYRRSWIFARDPAFAAKAGRVLDLYHDVWEGAPLRQVMAQPPYSEAERVYWIVDNGSSHRGQRSIERLRRRYRRHPELVLVHLPVHASWLNQIEIYFSIVQRKVLTPNDFDTLRHHAETGDGEERHPDRADVRG